MEVKRSYDHKGRSGNEGFGHIGDVKLVAPDGTWKLDGKALPDQSVEHLLNFALQTLQDAYAGADSPEAARMAFQAKRDKLLDGTIGVRGNAGAPQDDVSKRARSAAKETIKRALIAKVGSAKVADLAASDAGKPYFKETSSGFVWDEGAVESFIERNAETRDYRAEAQAAIDREKAVADEIAL